MKRILTTLTALAVLPGCATLGLDGVFKRPSPTPEAATPSVDTARPQSRPAAPAIGGGTAQTAEALDTTSAAEKVAAKSASGGNDLGVTIASLGSPAEQGFWLKTPLVTAPGKGRVQYGATGESVEVDLIPLNGPKTGGSQLSLAAMRLIGAPLTGLPEVRVFRLPG